MLLAGFSFVLFDKERTIFRFFSSSYGFVVILNSKDHSSWGWFRNLVGYRVDRVLADRKETIRNFAARIIGEQKCTDEFFERNHGFLRAALVRYLKEQSEAPIPVGRYYERMCLARNLALSITTILLLNIRWEHTIIGFEKPVYQIYFFVLLIVVLLIYSLLQSIWSAEAILIRTYSILSIINEINEPTQFLQKSKNIGDDSLVLHIVNSIENIVGELQKLNEKLQGTTSGK
jgi:hypothetical protein